MSGVMESSELQEALDVIESTNLKYFTKEMVAEFMALKGSFLAQIGRCVCVPRAVTYSSIRIVIKIGAYIHGVLVL